MNGGIFEGISKIFKKPYALKINCILAVIILVLSIISTVAFAQIPPDVLSSGSSEVDRLYFNYLFKQEPLTGISMIVLCILLAAYIVNIISNAVNIAKESINGNTEADTMPLLPDFKFVDILKTLPGMLVVGIVWMLYYVLIIAGFFGLIIGISGSKTGLLEYAFSLILCISLYSALYMTVYPIVWAKFADERKILPAINPLLGFKILYKAFLPTLCLFVKIMGISALIIIVSLVVLYICALIFSLLGHAISIFVMTCVATYLGIVASIGYYYNAAFIYTKNMLKRN